MGVAPIAINFMLACHCSGSPENDLGREHWNSPAGIEIREWLHENGLIDDDNRSTERGCAWIEFICKTPLPKAAWVLPDGAEQPE